MHITKPFEFFFSNRLEILYQQLKNSLFGPGTSPFMRRIVVVYGPAMELWLTLRMSQDPELSIATGIEFIYLSQAFETLLKLSSTLSVKHIPTSCELALAIEKECMAAIVEFKNFTISKQREWSPLIHYLKISPHRLAPTLHLSRKIQKRLISLSQHLAHLFQNYGRFAPQMTREWEAASIEGWQPQLWRNIFKNNPGWTSSTQALMEQGSPTHFFTVHFFSISFVTASEFAFLNRLSQHIPISYYLISPCAIFWSDIRSDRERAYLQAFWQKKKGPFSPEVINLEELLSDRNPLLANYGRIGREMASQIEDSHAIVHAHYSLPHHVKELGSDLFIGEDIVFVEDPTPLTLLHAIQADILLMRNPQEQPPIQLEEARTIQLHIATNKRRELEILYHNLLSLIADDPALIPGEIIVMAPQISDYVPYIESIFGSKESLLDYQILDLGMQLQSEVVQGFLQLVELSESRWDTGSLLQLFSHPSFQRRHQLTVSDKMLIQEWIEQTGIHWGENWIHRNTLLQKRHCEQGMVEEVAMGTWDYGLSRLFFGLTTVADKQSDSMEIPPCSSVEFSQSELLGKWIQILNSLRDDLSPLEDETRMTVDEWVNFLLCLLENYFLPDFGDADSLEEYSNLKRQLEVLRKSGHSFKETTYPFATIKAHLLSLLQHRGMTYREDHVQAVRFCSLLPLRSIPAKAIALIGMNEGTFPRLVPHSSLNLMASHRQSDYCPLAPDYDRYLFLEALHSAQDYLLFSYQGYSQVECKEQLPSLIIDEFFSYLDKYYTVKGVKPSTLCTFKHPYDSFDPRYFTKEKKLKNYSNQDFNVSQTAAKTQKKAPHAFIGQFFCTSHPQQNVIPSGSTIDISHLSAAARHPIKFHLNRILDIRIETAEERKLKGDEEIVISPLDKYFMKQYALKDPIERVLYRAEREGKLPLGLFKTLAAKRLKEEIEDIYERLKKHHLTPSNLFQIKFCPSCTKPEFLDDNHWLLPPVQVNYEDGYHLSIVGKIHHVTPKGLFTFGKGTQGELWKIWPQFLLFCHAADLLLPEKIDKQLIFSHAAKTQGNFFNSPEAPLKQFISYYSLCLTNFSPLLPDWIPHIVKGDSVSLREKIEQVFEDAFGGFPDHSLRWVLNKRSLPSAEAIIESWKKHVDTIFC